MAGHSKWANIKHRKARQDAKKGKIWGKLSKAILVAARQGGGDAATNLALRYAIDEAKDANMPKATIENAIRKGTGADASENYESLTYEGYASNGVAVLVECLTENKNRTVSEIRKTFDKHGGNLGTAGSVEYLFHVKGQISISREQVEEDRIMEIALEAGAEDVTAETDDWQITADPSAFQDVKAAVDQAGVRPEMATLTRVATLHVPCTGTDAQRVVSLIEDLEDLEDVQKVYANFDIPDEELAAMSG